VDWRSLVKLDLFGVALGFVLITSAAFAADLVDLSHYRKRLGSVYCWRPVESFEDGHENAEQSCVVSNSNPADEGTPDSTNAAVMLFEVDSPDASARYARVRQRYENGTKS